ncbi:divalent cation tolerance protein [Candidatus Kryptobacter tengchongensis]|uniref:Divalent cation tolerance protein n=1 Tax=Kryptobacter tengchongensis TaxID=1643429 RepID=A0A656D061_KRYT1|nr:divalent-cation tolerance protein CutA [Candidatus Kryptobacter tengchongensis]CUS92897.1 divalent cation tolerance protein [Candidatus Kryptobacter tengchongensis]CUS98168.1 divalent cation tolerance protein [Candidatus Kryptobacter tengchongensis]CUT00744.1 divalent cation tolerance protein [Candidatus Kryptobacter tengchongensis]CUU04378.1 divalent cation tolerance protein [Candidatus Kryptobacter tengchongensis]CUU09148.1 divalent cation tolerance protein [Candidatus Kryptobacter tengch
MTDYIVVLITTPNVIEARKISKTLVEEKLAACCNVIEKVNSIYFWQNNIEDDFESLIIIKTRKDVFPELVKRVKELHKYTVPEIIAIPIIEGSDSYLNWIDETVKQTEK